MQRLLALVVTLHWAVVFALLAGLCVFGGHPPGQMAPLFTDMPVQTGIGTVSQPLRLFFSVLFALCSALFVWAMITALGKGQGAERAQAEVNDKAFAIASLAMTALLISSAVQPSGLGLSGVAMVYAALIVSFVALRAEHPPMQDEATSDITLALKGQAVDATYGSLVARLTKSSSDLPEAR